MKKIFLVDGDNNINLGLRGIEMLSEENQVLISHSKAMEITKFKKKLAGCRAQIDFIESVRSGKNSLDFQITTELGFLSHNKDLEGAYIISCDKGYDAAVDYVKSRYSAKFKELDRRESIFDCFQLAFALKAKTKNELSSALVKEYGPEHGLLVYNHLKTLFGDVAEEAPAEVQTDAKLMEKAEKTVAEVQSRVKKTVKKVEKKATEERRKTRPERKPKAASVHTKKLIEPEVVVKEPAVEAVIKEEPTKLDAAAEVVVEKVEAVVQKAADITDLPLRFGAVRTDEQNKSFYKSKDLRKKSKPQEEAADAKEEVKVEPEHVEAVVEMIQEKRPQRREGQRNGDRRSSNRGRDGQRRPRRESQGEPAPEGKVVPMKPRREELPKQDAAKPAETTKPAAVKTAEAKSEAVAAKKEAPAQKSAAAAPAKKASGQNNPGFFGRMFGKKKK
ncbi:MAG: hypothetical protein IJN41_04515 [Firmicutes bacterium]|nr:hypothetical protein [Bacillota bacterium]